MVVMLFTFVFVGSGAVASSRPAAPQDMETKTKRGAKKVYTKGRWVTRTTWYHGKKVTKKVWVKTKWVGRKVSHRTKKILHGTERRIP